MPDDVTTPSTSPASPPPDYKGLSGKPKLTLAERQRRLAAKNTPLVTSDPVAAAILKHIPQPSPQDFKLAAKEQVRSQIREFLDVEITIGRGRHARTAKRLQHIAETLFKIATDRRSPFAVPAANALLDRGFGKPVAGDVDDASTRKGGLTVVYVDRNALDSSIPLVKAEELQQRQLSAPEFIDSEVVEDGR